MPKKKSLIHSTSKGSITAKYKQKDWVKKLEAASGKPVKIPQKTGNVYLLIDCSGSMSDSNKMEQAKNGSIAFSDEAIKQGYSVGLIAFAYSGELILEPQRELTVLRNSIMRLIPNGSTNLTSALNIAEGKLVDKSGEKMLCIVTDGMPDNSQLALEAAKAAHYKGIDIMTIGTDDADRSFLRKLSTRDELSIKVSSSQLEQGIISMAKMLPGKR